MHYFSSIGSGVRELRWPQIPYFLYLAIMTLTTVSTTVLYCDITNGFKPSPSFFFLIRCRLCISRLLSPFLILNIHVRSSVLFTSWFHTKLSHFLQCVQNPHSTRCFYARYTIILTISGSTTSRNLQSSAYLFSSMSLLRSHVLQWATKGPTAFVWGWYIMWLLQWTRDCIALLPIASRFFMSMIHCGTRGRRKI